MHYQDVTDKAADFVRTYMREHPNNKLCFHTPAYTENVVAAATALAKQSHLSSKELLVTLTAAWFYHIGYYSDPANPRQAAVGLVEEFLKRLNTPADIIKEVQRIIGTTQITQHPPSLVEQIVSDAAQYYLGTDTFAEQNRLLRKEWEGVHGIKVGKEEWNRRTIVQMENHQYYTDSCRQLLNKKKKQNLDKLKRKLKGGTELPNPVQGLLEGDHLQQDLAEKDKAVQHPEKATETLFRITAGVSQRLSEQADNKANILISVNSIMMSILLSIVVTRLDRYPHLTIPIILFMAVNLITITFSVLATRPNVPKGLFEHSELEKRKVNLLFFGNFYRMDFDEYAVGMYKVLGDRHYLYYSFIKNHYEHGVVLGRKYSKLKIAYNIFMYGIIISVVGFLIASQFFAP